MALKLHQTYGIGYERLEVLRGGWKAWVDAGYPTAVGASQTGRP